MGLLPSILNPKIHQGAQEPTSESLIRSSRDLSGKKVESTWLLQSCYSLLSQFKEIRKADFDDIGDCSLQCMYLTLGPCQVSLLLNERINLF